MAAANTLHQHPLELYADQHEDHGTECEQCTAVERPREHEFVHAPASVGFAGVQRRQDRFDGHTVVDEDATTGAANRRHQ